MLQGRHEEGIALLERVAEATPELSAPRIDLGIAQHIAGDLEAAEASLLLALESNPEQPVALVDRLLFVVNGSELWSSDGTSILVWRDGAWAVERNLAPDGISGISRMAVSPDGAWTVYVADQDTDAELEGSRVPERGRWSNGWWSDGARNDDGWENGSESKPSKRCWLFCF